MEKEQGVALRVISPFMLDGDMVLAGEVIETTVREAKQFLARGKVVLATGGPTVAEYVAAGYRAENYPPQGYESLSTAEEIKAAIAAQGGAGEAGK